MVIKKFLGQILLQMKLVTIKQLERALQIQTRHIEDKTTHDRGQRVKLVSDSREPIDAEKVPMLGQLLTDMGFLSDEQLSKALKEQDKSFEAYKLLDNAKLGLAIEIGSLVNSTLNFVEVLNLIMKNVNHVTNSVASTLMLLDEDTGELVFSVPTGPKADELTDIRLPPGEGIAGWVAEYGRPLLVSDVKKDARFYPKIDDISGLETRSILCIPLKAKTKLIGVLEVINKADGTLFTQEDEMLLSIFGYKAAVAIENARLHNEVQEQLEELKLAEKALKSEKLEKETILESLIDHVVYQDSEHKILWANRAACQSAGMTREELRGRYCYEIWLKRDKPCEDCPLSLAMATGQMCEIEKRTPEGRLWFIRGYPVRDLNGNIASGIEITQDITERKKAEEVKQKVETQLMQAQKLQAIGTLAGGIAHDFNNILMAIIGFTEIASTKAEKGSSILNNLKNVLEASNRAKDLVSQILSFTRQSDEEKKPIQISPIVKEALKLLRATLPSTIEIRQHIENEPMVVESDPTKIHQIMMNICTNAHHAMYDKGGVLDVAMVPVELEAEKAADFHALLPGSYIRLSIADTGIGMDQSTMDRIFEPYFTTKEKSEGTGLGLAVVHGIVKGNNGTITVESEPGKGTTFHVYLPRVAYIEDVSKPDTPISLPKGRESILFVDDEQILADMGKEMLEDLGYKVVSRTSSIEALELFRTKPDRFDLIITDMTMPNMTGDDLSKELLKIRPDIPIILCTGFSEKISAEKTKIIGIREFVMKPFALQAFAETVRKVLDDNQG